MKTKDELLAKLKEVESDDRLVKYQPANVQINAPLALIQVDLEAKASTLRWALGMPPVQYPLKKKGAGK